MRTLLPGAVLAALAVGGCGTVQDVVPSRTSEVTTSPTTPSPAAQAAESQPDPSAGNMATTLDAV